MMTCYMKLSKGLKTIHKYLLFFNIISPKKFNKRYHFLINLNNKVLHCKNNKIN